MSGSSHEKKLFKRLLHSHHDLMHARACARQILKRSLYEAPRGSDDWEMLECLNTALVVSYWRPFSDNQNTEDVRSTLPNSYLRELTPEERMLHKHIGEYRNRDHAHSDPESRSIAITVEFWKGPVAIPIGRDPFVPLLAEDVRLLEGMIEKLLQKIIAEQVRIQGQLDVGDRF